MAGASVRLRFAKYLRATCPGGYQGRWRIQIVIQTRPVTGNHSGRVTMRRGLLPMSPVHTSPSQGHEDIPTTEIYTHVAKGAKGMGVVSPLGRMERRV